MYSFMRIWGCEAMVKRLTSDKFKPKSDKCKFVGYPKETRGYQFYLPSKNKVFVARTAVFLEKEFITRGNSRSKIDLDEDREPQTVFEPEEEPELLLQRVAVIEIAQDEQGGQEIVPPQAPQPNQSAQAIAVQGTGQVTQGPRRSGRTRHEPERYYGFLVTQS